MLEAVFMKPPSEIFARHKLATHKQQPSETINHFCQSLKLLAKDCDFKDVTVDVYTPSLQDFPRPSSISDCWRRGLFPLKKLCNKPATWRWPRSTQKYTCRLCFPATALRSPQRPMLPLQLQLPHQCKEETKKHP